MLYRRTGAEKFNFQYPDADSFLMTSASIGQRHTSTATCKADVVNQMQIMMRMLVTLTNTLAPLPEDRWLTMKVRIVCFLHNLLIHHVESNEPLV